MHVYKKWTDTHMHTLVSRNVKLSLMLNGTRESFGDRHDYIFDSLFVPFGVKVSIKQMLTALACSLQLSLVLSRPCRCFSTAAGILNVPNLRSLAGCGLSNLPPFTAAADKSHMR